MRTLCTLALPVALCAAAAGAATGFAASAIAAELSPAPQAAKTQLAAVTAVALTEEDRNEIRRIERYFNALRSIRARFVQISDTGRYAEGKLFFVRPDKLRFEYEPPVKLLVVANGGWITQYDGDMKQANRFPLINTPLQFLTKPQISFASDVTITAIERSAGVIRVEIVETKDPSSGRLTLTFSREPMELRKWTITDQQGTTVNVALFNAETNAEISPELFIYKELAPSEPGRGN